MKLTLLGACMGIGALLAVAGSAQAEWKLGGYTQVRLNSWDRDLDADSFDLRRVYVKAEGQFLDQATTAKVQVDLGGLDDGVGEIKLKDALVTHKFSSAIKGAAGFTSVPFGFEVPASNASLLPLERSEVERRFFPGERATGLWFLYRPPAHGPIRPQVDLGYTNGISKWYEADASGNKDSDSHAFFGRVQVPFAKTGLVGVSTMAATRHRTIGGVDTSFGAENVFGAHLRYDAPVGLGVQAEVYTGEVLNVNISGWYGQVEYRLPRRSQTLFYRYDTSDRHLAHVYTRHTGGLAWDINKRERFTLQGEFLDDYVDNGMTNYCLQYQIKY